MLNGSTGRLVIFGLLWACLGIGCSCDDEVIVPTKSCNLRETCGAGMVYRHGQCIAERCAADGDCCAGERCGAGGKCGPVEDRCSNDLDCTASGFRCLEEEGRKRCRLPRCSVDTDCDVGQCFQRRCVVEPSCLGGCEAGTFCDPPSNRCLPVPPAAVGCDISCGDGEALMLTDPVAMRGAGGVCCWSECACTALPEITPRDIGLHLDAVGHGGEIVVAAYERHFGDLVFTRLSPAGAVLSLEFVDGLPAGGAQAGSAAGARGGLLEPGPDVGRFPSLALTAEGTPYIAYRDEAAGSLKLAYRVAKDWVILAVDVTGDTGFEPHIVLDSSGRPHIAYRTRSRGGEVVLRLAVADRADPTTTGHWRITDVVARPTCIAGCDNGHSCVLVEDVERCLPNNEGCGACGGGTRCVLDAEPLCAEVAHAEGSVDDRTLGHRPYVVMDGGRDVIVYGDVQRGTINMAIVAGGRLEQNIVVDGTGGELGQVIGGLGVSQAAALGADGGWVIAYRDVLRNHVRVYRGDRSLSARRVVLDDGLAAASEVGGLDRVHGSDMDVLLDSTHESIVFQDQSLSDAVGFIDGRRIAGRSTKADGFSARVARVANRSYAVHGAMRTDRDGVARFSISVTPLVTGE
jgi:hypothetical protein